MVQHMTNSMTSAEESNDVWYVDSGASNHMTGHAEWMQDARKMEKPGFVETGDDTAHPIVQIGKIPLSMQDGKKKYLSDVFHVPNITKNLVSVGQKWLSRACRSDLILMDALLRI